MEFCVRMEVLANTMVVIILQQVNISNQQVVNLILTQCDVSTVSQKGWRKLKK